MILLIKLKESSTILNNLFMSQTVLFVIRRYNGFKKGRKVLTPISKIKP